MSHSLSHPYDGIPVFVFKDDTNRSVRGHSKKNITIGGGGGRRPSDILYEYTSRQGSYYTDAFQTLYHVMYMSP